MLRRFPLEGAKNKGPLRSVDDVESHPMVISNTISEQCADGLQFLLSIEGAIHNLADSVKKQMESFHLISYVSLSLHDSPVSSNSSQAWNALL